MLNLIMPLCTQITLESMLGQVMSQDAITEKQNTHFQIVYQLGLQF